MKIFNKISMVLLVISYVLGLMGPSFASAAGPLPVNLLSVDNFAILSKAGITNTGSHTTAITGNIGSSPITAAAMNTVFCSEITGTIYGVDAAYVGSGSQTCFAGNPPLANKTLVDNAAADMLTAYTDAEGRTLPTATELGAGNIGGMTLAPGLYKWSTGVTIPSNLTLSGSTSDVWIFQIAGDLSIASGGSVPAGVKVVLTGGAQAANVFWQVGGPTGATLGTYSTFNGNILSAKQVIIQTGAVLNGRALAQTQVTLDANAISVAKAAQVNQTCSTINLSSSANSQTAGYTETTQTSAPSSLTAANYSGGAFVAATPTQAVIPPWVDPATHPNFTGSGAVWISTHSTWPGGAGNAEGQPENDQWRLFHDTFTIPAGATVTSANLYFTGDNAVDIHLNGAASPITTTNDTYGPTPGSLPFHFANVFTTSFSPTAGTNTLDFVLRNWGGSFSSNPTGLLYKAVIDYCVPDSVKVTLVKYLDGQPATANSANNTSFSMTSTWNATNIGSGSGNFSLGPVGFNNPNPYQATTSDMSPGASYSAIENLGTSCSTGQPFALVGYSTGNTQSQATAGAPTANTPSFTNLAGDKFIIVWNQTCQTTPPITPDVCFGNPLVAPPGYTLQYGTTGNDTVTLAPNTMFVGKSGNDKVSGGIGNYIICTGSGSDIITLGNGDSIIHAGNGNNTITTGDGTGNIVTTTGNDKITVGNGAHTIKAGEGINIVLTGDGNQSITTGNGKDTITTAGGNDTIAAGHGNNIVKAGNGDDSITAGTGNDNIDGGGGTDVCSAGIGTNTVTNCP